MRSHRLVKPAALAAPLHTRLLPAALATPALAACGGGGGGGEDAVAGAARAGNGTDARVLSTFYAPAYRIPAAGR